MHYLYTAKGKDSAFHFSYTILYMNARIKVIAFDADDTLWNLQSYFDQVEKEYCALLSDYGSARFISAELFKTESANMAELGYGVKAFTLSLIENAIRVSNGTVPAETLERIMKAGRSLHFIPATPLPGVYETLKTLHERGEQQMILFTKGELLDQEQKLRRSGLRPFFHDVHIVSDKTDDAYRHLCDLSFCSPESFMMVGNSFKSDILPVLRLGGWGVHIPSPYEWQHEKTEEFDHEHLIRLSHFADLLTCGII